MKSPVGVLCQNDEVDKFGHRRATAQYRQGQRWLARGETQLPEPGKFFVCGNAALRGRELFKSSEHTQSSQQSAGVRAGGRACASCPEVAPVCASVRMRPLAR